MQQMLNEIESDSRASREQKELEWRQACREYDDLSQKISSETCICTVQLDGSRDVHGCVKCFHFRVRRRMSITSHEDFLPEEAAQKSTIVFELGIPPYLQEYRLATWRVLFNLHQPNTSVEQSPPKIFLNDFLQLKPYRRSAPQGVTLASVKKSFLQTHYKEQRMKVDLPSILLPCGLSFSYYDEHFKSWLGSFKEPVTFQHLCGVRIPRALLRAGVPDPTKASWVSGPSSYEIVASQTRCPLNMYFHEFTALQTLLGGSHRRWMTILAELASSNVNFSDEESTHFCQMAVQAGPTQKTTDVLRDAHVIFREDLFCECLRKQVERRLRLIETNWREVHGMEMLLTLALRLHALTSGEMRGQAYELIKFARRATLGWNLHLRDKSQSAKDADEAKRLAQYRFQAALLCRRTFAIFVDQKESIMDAEELCTFVTASISLQQSLVVDPAKLPPRLESMFMRDMKTAYRCRSVLQEAVRSHAESLGPAICSTWSSEPRERSSRRFDPWKVLHLPHDAWIVSVMRNETRRWAAPVGQVVHYNVIEGHLLIQGQPLGKPPLDIIESRDIKDLFGNQHLLTFPSPLSGMSHMLAAPQKEHEVHFGTRTNQVVIRARRWNQEGNDLLEYIPREMFQGNSESDFDLPAELIDGCVHWLDLGTGNLEIRRPAIWKSRPGNWTLNVLTRQATRRETRLVNPHSSICKTINSILSGFEMPYRVMISQPRKSRLTVDLKQLELRFFVNGNRLLQCQQLQAEIDPDQDAGTLRA